MRLRIGLFIVAALLLAAHFYRAGWQMIALACACSPLLFAWRNRLSLIALQVLAYCGVGVWIHTTINLVELRQITGRPWTTGAIILGGVALLTLVAGLMLNAHAMDVRYPRLRSPDTGGES